MISKKIFLADGANARFLSEFIIASEQFTRVYVYIYDNSLNPNGTEDKLVDGSTDHNDWSFPDNLWKRGANAPDSGNDLMTIDKWSLVTNSILFFAPPPGDATVWIEVATTSDEFGDTLIQPQVAQAEAAAVAASVSENNAKTSEDAVAADLVLTNADVVSAQLLVWEAEAEKLTADSYATEAEDILVKSYESDGDSTFTPTDTADYSSAHWAQKAKDRANVIEGNLYGSLVAITANLTGSHPIPASGVVDTRGYMYCDGSVIPGGQVLSGTLPNLTDGRFLRGSTTAGAVGGSNEFTLIEANLPAHTHNADHNHPTGSTNSTGDHYHNTSWGESFGGTYGYDGVGVIGAGSSIDYDNRNYRTNTKGSHSHTVTIPTKTMNTGSTGSGTAVSHIPQYVNVVYLLKVN